MLKPEEFFYLLSDETRLRCLLLLQARNECCVCDFTYALQKNQPKISRHLAILRGSSVVSDRRAGSWIYYSLHANLPAWAARLLSAIAKETFKLYSSDLLKINERDRTLCEKTFQSQKNNGVLSQNFLINTGP
ncbi:MAG: metalloregulator ArsR/SmtB family transcription factor [Gammaproteobacteria bacterium]|nr:metalloregulator ArsR/SmtB family transcription factor [Gammaproteobacteria bacterium]